MGIKFARTQTIEPVRIYGIEVTRPIRTILTAIKCTESTVHFMAMLGDIGRVLSGDNTPGLRTVAQPRRIMVSRLLRRLLGQTIRLHMTISPIELHVAVNIVVVVVVVVDIVCVLHLQGRKKKARKSITRTYAHIPNT